VGGSSYYGWSAKSMRLDNFINEGINDKAILHACFMAGAPGSGKSHTLQNIKSGQIEARIVNTDKLFEYLGNTNVQKSKLLTLGQLRLYVDSMLPLFIDGTSTNSSTTLKRKALLETVGYKTGMIFVNCDLETSLERARKRKRVVPDEIVIKSYEAMEKVKPIYKSAFEFFAEISNNDGDLDNDSVIKAFRKTSGFFTSEPSQKGEEIIEKMKAENWKYLTDGIYSESFFSQIVSNWYDIIGGQSI